MEYEGLEYEGFNLLMVWDMDNQPAKDIDILDVAHNLQLAAERKFPGISIFFKGFGDADNMDKRRAYYHSPTTFHDVPGLTPGEDKKEFARLIDADRDIMNAMHEWAMDHPAPGFVFLFSSDGDYACTLETLRTLGFTTVVCCDPVVVHEKLIENADYTFDVSDVRHYGRFVNGYDRYGNYVGLGRLMHSGIRLVPPSIRPNTVFWDMNTIRLPPGMYQDTANEKIYRYLSRNVPTIHRNGGMLDIRVYGDKRHLPVAGKDSSAVIYTVTIEGYKPKKLVNKMIADMWHCSNRTRPGSNMIVYSADERLASTIRSIRSKGRNMVVCLPPTAHEENPLRLAGNTCLASPHDWKA